MITAALLVLPALAQDPPPAPSGWNRFRGPNGSGVASDAQLPALLDPERNVLWRQPLPPGYSSPVLSDQGVLLTSYEELQPKTWCFDRETGEVVWSAEAPPLAEPPRGPNSPAAPSACSDGANAYVYFGHCGLLSYDAAGELRWQHELEPLNTPYGVGTSPIVHEGLVLLQGDQDTHSYLLAVDAATGEERWRVPRAGFTHGFSTPVVHAPQDGPAELIVSGSYRLCGYELATGAERWYVGGMAWQAKSTPVLGDDMLYVHSWMAAPSELGAARVTESWEEALEGRDADANGSLEQSEVEDLGLARLWFLYDMNQDDVLDAEEWGFLLARGEAENGLYGIALGGEGDLSESAVRWRHKRSLPNIPSPLLHDGVLYLLKEGGILNALDPESGEVLKAGRVSGAEDGYYSSPIAAGERILLTSHGGSLAVLSAGAEWDVLSVHDLGEEIWGTAALEGDAVYVRSQEALYRFGPAELAEDG